MKSSVVDVAAGVPAVRGLGGTRMSRDYTSEMAEIDAPVGEHVTWWKHDPRVLGGVVVVIGEVETSDFGTQRVIKLRAEDGELFGRSINGQLQSQLSDNKVQIDDEVGIKFCGRRVSQTSGREYNTYAVRVFAREDGGPAKAGPGADEEKFEDDIPF